MHRRHSYPYLVFTNPRATDDRLRRGSKKGGRRSASAAEAEQVSFDMSRT
jgi:hypothetical protein